MKNSRKRFLNILNEFRENIKKYDRTEKVLLQVDTISSVINLKFDEINGSPITQKY
ncbi:MAG: hypothetical protein ACTSPN_02070 [Promethearchaeota archaeon]